MRTICHLVIIRILVNSMSLTLQPHETGLGGQVREQKYGFHTIFELKYNGDHACFTIVVLIPWGEWDLRKKAIQGKASHLLKYLDFLDENAAQLAYNYTGDPTSYFIMDLAGFSLRKSACIACEYTNYGDLPFTLFKKIILVKNVHI